MFSAVLLSQLLPFYLEKQHLYQISKFITVINEPM